MSELVSLHGPNAAAHDYHTGEPGSFARALERIGRAREDGVEVRVTTSLTRSSYRVLAEMIPLLRAHGASEWWIEVPTVEPPLSFDRIAPRLALALPYALHAIDRARKLGLVASIRGAPLCLLGPHASDAVPSEPRAYGAPCAACPERPRCPGVQREYLERFGGDELRPVVSRSRGPRGSRAPGGR